MAQTEQIAAEVAETARKRAVIYLRVSTTRQADKGEDPDGYSLPAQRDACYRKAEALGADVVDEYMDRGQSATTSSRPQFLKMVERIKTLGDVEYVICDKLNRFARNRRDDANFLFELRQAGAQLISVKENVDESPAGQLLHAIMAGIAEFESRNLGAEALKGMLKKAELGGTPGRPPTGFYNLGRRLEDGREVRTIAVDPDRAPLVQWAFEAYSTGEWTITTLTEALRAKGLRSYPHARNRTPAVIQRSAVAKMLSDRYYIGIVTFRGQEYQGRHQPLVSRNTFETVQEVLRSRRHAGEKNRKHQHYLRGSIFCICGARLCFTRVKGNGGEYDYFFCVNRQQRRSTCQQGYMRVEAIEAAVEDYYTTAVRLPEDLQKKIREGLEADLAYQRTQAGPEIAHARRRVGQLADERKRLARGVVEGAIPHDLAREEHARIDQELHDAERTLVTSETIYSNIEETLHKALNYVGRCDEVYRLAGPKIRRKSNQFFFRKLLVTDERVVGAIYAEPWSTLLSEDLVKRLSRKRKTGNRVRVSSGHGSKMSLLAGPPGLELSSFLI